MPTICMFYGIIIRMYYIDHNPPHFHAFYGENVARFNFLGDIIEGELPDKQIKLIQAWIELHKNELEANWELAKNSERPFKILPLR